MAQGSIQSLKEMSTRNLPRGRDLSAYKADNLTAICKPIVQKMWDPRPLTIYGSRRSVTRIAFFLEFLGEL
jgi:hypothetical protein